MSEQGQFDLCPKCGAVDRDGICQSCGYEIPGIQDAIEQETTQQEMTQEETIQQEMTQEEATQQETIQEETAQQETIQQTDNGLYTSPDVYETQTGQDVYQTPDMSTGHHDTGGMFSGDHVGENAAYQQNTYDGSSQYGGQYENNNPYGSGNQYNGGQYANSSNQYGSGQYQYGNNQYGGGQYGNPNNQYGNGQYQYGNNQYGNQQYNNQQFGNNQYGNNQYNNQQYGNPYGPNPYGNNPYSPYAVPPAKKHTGLIVGVAVTVVILFLIAILAMFYHLLETSVQGREVSKDINTYVSPEDIQDDDNNRSQNEWHRNDDIYDDDDDERDKRNKRDDDYDYNDDEYYTLQDDIKSGLSYSIDWEYYDYKPNDNVQILIDYPIIVGSRVPNRDKINALLADEVAFFTEYYEDKYSAYMDEDSYFIAQATGYVTYMSEDVLSVVFSETINSDYYVSVYCYSINIDMQDGVIMDNTDIIAVDDDFSIDFRYRSEKQNGTIDALDWMSDQEITEYLTSSGNLIIYYTPMGMEIGFNYDEGWVTVTYHDYKDFLKIF